MERMFNWSFLRFLFVFLQVSFWTVEASSDWTRSESNGEIITKRQYAEISGQRRIDVESRCVTRKGSEAQFGQCSHKVSLNSGRSQITLNDGEAVFLTENEVIATYDFECCGAPGGVSFYDDKGKLLGKTWSYRRPNPAFSNRTNDIGSVKEKKSRYLVVLKDPAIAPATLKELELIDPKDPKVHEVVRLNIPHTNCGWIPEFASLENKTLDLTFIPVECGKKSLRSICAREVNVWTCKSTIQD